MLIDTRLIPPNNIPEAMPELAGALPECSRSSDRGGPRSGSPVRGSSSSQNSSVKSISSGAEPSSISLPQATTSTNGDATKLPKAVRCDEPLSEWEMQAAELRRLLGSSQTLERQRSLKDALEQLEEQRDLASTLPEDQFASSSGLNGFHSFDSGSHDSCGSSNHGRSRSRSRSPISSPGAGRRLSPQRGTALTPSLRARRVSSSSLASLGDEDDDDDDDDRSSDEEMILRVGPDVNKDNNSRGGRIGSANNNNNGSSNRADIDSRNASALRLPVGDLGLSAAAAAAIPRIDLGPRMAQGGNLVMPRALAAASPDLTDAPLSGRGGSSLSARPGGSGLTSRPMSARWSGATLRTVPENAPFVRPLSGVHKGAAAGSSADSSSGHGSVGTQAAHDAANSSAADPATIVGHIQQQWPRTAVRDERTGAARTVVISGIGGSSSGVRKTVANVSPAELGSSSIASAFAPYQGNEPSSPSDSRSIGFSAQSKPLPLSRQAQAQDSNRSFLLASSYAPPPGSAVVEILPAVAFGSLGEVTATVEQPIGSSSSSGVSDGVVQTSERSARVITACWASCVDPRWPPTFALHGHHSAVSANKHTGSSRALTSAATSGTSDSTSHGAPNAATSVSSARSHWVTSGGFPQRLRIAFAKPVQLARLQLFASGNPVLLARLTAPSSQTTTIPILPQPNQIVQGNERSPQFPTQFYVLDMPPAAAAASLEVVFETAASHFCAISHLQLWGA